MKKKIILLFLILVSCSNSSRISTSQIINKSIKAHGWDQEDFSIVFDFRDYQYELKRKNKFYSFQRYSFILSLIFLISSLKVW